MANFRCLVLDHDDTVVESAKTVNFPSYLAALNILRPEKNISFREFTLGLYRTDFRTYCRNTFGYTEEEMNFHYQVWKFYVRSHVPPVYAGIPALLRRFHQEGGIICMASHSASENINRDFQKYMGFLPDRIYGSDRPAEQCKPHAYPLTQIMSHYGFRPEEILVVDDMAGGLQMATAAGVPFACAGWSHEFSEIIRDMKAQTPYYLSTVEEFSRLVFG